MKFAEVRQFAMSLPEVTEQPHFKFSSFRVRGKIFVTVPPEEEHIHVFVAETVREKSLAAHPAILERLFWGGKVVGLRLALASADPSVVHELVRQAWMNKAPKALMAQVAQATE